MRHEGTKARRYGVKCQGRSVFFLHSVPSIPFHPTEEAGAVPQPARTGPAALLASHVLRDGEIVLLILKPSLWFIPLNSLLFAGIVAVVAGLGFLATGRVPGRERFYVDAATILIICRLMWATLRWMGRLYILTDQRILRLSGVFFTDVFDCPLRKIASATRSATVGEGVLGLGSIDILPADDRRLPTSWQTIAHPKQIHAVVVATISRAKQ
jgi:hypothetical protein